MSIDIKGTVVHIGDVKSFGSNGFTKRTFVVKTDEKYPQELPIDLTKDRVSLADTFSVGDQVSVSVNLKGRPWKETWFVSLEAWKVDAPKAATAPVGGGPTDPIPF